MKNTLLLALFTVSAAVSTASASQLIGSPHGKDNQSRFVYAEARVLGGRADRAMIVAPPNKLNRGIYPTK